MKLHRDLTSLLEPADDGRIIDHKASFTVRVGQAEGVMVACDFTSPDAL